MTSESIKQRVREFQKRTNFGRTDEDNFTPWWLQQRFSLSDEEATMLSSDDSFHLGVGGFHIHESSDKVTISLVQGVFSNNAGQMAQGINEVSKFLPKLTAILSDIESIAPHDILAKRLLNKIKKPSALKQKQIEFDAFVISLCDDGEIESSSVIEKAKSDLFRLFEKEVRNPNVVLSLSVLGLDNLIESGKMDSRRPAKPFTIHFDGSDEIDLNDSVFLSGFGKLADLVTLYEQKGNQLFEKNVRLYLYGKKNEQKGPAGKIRETLEGINNKKFEPEKFGFLHNGVTIYSTTVSVKKKDKSAELVNPSVLNGCQTIKSAFLFYKDAIAKNKLSSEAWNKIPVSIRIVATDDKELWREVAEANNRQNSMSAAALRANDEIQIILENRFKDLGIFYERQEGAFENLVKDDKDKFLRRYPNTNKEPVYIDTLVQAIICSSEMPLAYASRTGEVFESKKIYDKVFSQKNLKNLSFLVLAHNIRRVMDHAVRDAVPGNATKIYADFKPSRYRDLFTRLVLKTIIKQNLLNEFLTDYGVATLSPQGKIAVQLIESLKNIIKSADSPLLQKITDLYRKYDDAAEKYYWEKQVNQELYESISSKLRVSHIDVFERIQGL